MSVCSDVDLLYIFFLLHDFFSCCLCSWEMLAWKAFLRKIVNFGPNESLNKLTPLNANKFRKLLLFGLSLRPDCMALTK